MQITMLKAKLHRARVTHSELEYEGSCAIDGTLLDATGIREYEQIHIYNVNNGERFITYAIRARDNSGIVSINGAAARLAAPSDIIIVCAYVTLTQNEVKNYNPTLVYVNNRNQIARMSNEIAAQTACLTKD